MKFKKNQLVLTVSCFKDYNNIKARIIKVNKNMFKVKLLDGIHIGDMEFFSRVNPIFNIFLTIKEKYLC